MAKDGVKDVKRMETDIVFLAENTRCASHTRECKARHSSLVYQALSSMCY